MESEYNKALSMDIQNLISCIHWHEGSDNEQVVLETLKTITDICANESCARDALREESGLDFLVEFMFTTDNAIFLEHSLKTLACVIDENIHNQMYMTKKSVFEVIQTILRNRKFPVVTRKNAIILVSAILYQNSTAQSLICEVGLLHDLLNAYEQGGERLLTGSSYAPTSHDPLNELWMTSNSALCFAVNNPKNDTNQEVCSTIFQISLRILDISSNADIIGSVSALLSLCISNNRYCQDKFAKHDGLLACKRLLQKYFDLVLADIKDCNNIIGKGALQMISSIIGIISAAASDHENNAALLGKLGVVSLLVKLLFVKTLDINLKIKIVLSLGHCIDACCSNKSFVLEIENFDNLLKENLRIEDEELSSACKYLLNVCLMQEEDCDQEEIARVNNYIVGVNSASESFKGESKCKRKCPETKKNCMTTEKRSSTKRPSSCISSPKSKDDCNQKCSSKYSNIDKLQPPKSQLGTSNGAQSNPVNVSGKQSSSHPRCEAESTGKKGYVSSIFGSLKNIVKNSTLNTKPSHTQSKTDLLHDKECQISDSSSDSSSTYYSAGALLKKMQPQIEASNIWPFDPSCISSSKSKDDYNQKRSSTYSNTDKLQPPKSQLDTSNGAQSNPVNLSGKQSSSHPRCEAESTGKKGYVSSIFGSLKNIVKNSTLNTKPSHTQSKTDLLHDKECQISDSSSDSSSTYYSAGALLKKMQPQIEASNIRSFDPSNNKIPSSSLIPRKIPQGGLFSKGKNEKPLNSKRILMDRTNFEEPDSLPSQKKMKFMFDPVLTTPNEKSPQVWGSKRQTPELNSDFTPSMNYSRRPEKFSGLSRTCFEGGRKTILSSLKNSASSPVPSHKRCAAPETSNLSRGNAKRIKRFLSSSTPGICPSPSELNESYSSNCVQVIAFPGDKCEEHNLISSFESLQVVPLDEVQRP